MMVIILVVAAGVLFGAAFLLWSSAADAEKIVKSMRSEDVAPAWTQADEPTIQPRSSVNETFDQDAPVEVRVPVPKGGSKGKVVYSYGKPEKLGEGEAVIIRMHVERTSDEGASEDSTSENPTGSSSA